MTAYVRWLPGPDSTPYINSFAELWALLGNSLQPEYSGDFGGDAIAATWYPTSFTSTLGGEPYWTINWASTVGGHTCAQRLRYNPALWGTLDPSIPLGSDNFYPTIWLSTYDFATLATWRTRATAGAVTSMLSGGYLSTLITSLCANNSLSLLATDLTYTEGARNGGWAGLVSQATYNPTSGELAAGIRQLIQRRAAMVSDAEDGTLNVVVGGSTIGQAQSQVPVLVLDSSQGVDSWTEYNNTVSQVWNDFSVTSYNNYTNQGDLHLPPNYVREPPVGQGTPVYDEPNILPKLIDGTFPMVLNTTLPAQLISFLCIMGTIFQKLIPVAELVVGSAVSLVAAPAAIATACTSMALSQASIANSTESQATDLSNIREDIQKIRIALEGDETLPEPILTVAKELHRAANKLGEVAETRSYIHLRSHGIEVEAESGGILEA